MNDINIKEYGGTKISIPITMAIGVIMGLVIFGFSSYGYLSSNFVTKEAYKEDIGEVKALLQGIKSDLVNIKVTLKMKGMDIERVER